LAQHIATMREDNTLVSAMRCINFWPAVRGRRKQTREAGQARTIPRTVCGSPRATLYLRPKLEAGAKTLWHSCLPIMLGSYKILVDASTICVYYFKEKFAREGGAMAK